MNPRWLAMRQLILYNLLLRCYGSQNSEGVESQGVSCDSFMDFLQVLSGTDESPTYFGIDNDKWSRFARSEGSRYNSDSSIGYLGEDNRSVEGAKMRTTLDIMDQSTLAESLAISKVQLASKQEALEKLELSYLKLEKLHTQLKLELAMVKAERDGA